MKKKIFTSIFAIVAGWISLHAQHQYVEIDDFYYNLDDDSQTAELLTWNGWTERPTTIDIPASVEYETITYSVTKIGDNAFRDWNKLALVFIPNSVTTIGEYAFFSCQALISITIPNSVTTIGDYAFCWCSELLSANIGNGVTTIGNYTFANCYKLSSITIPNSVTTIGGYAFDGCGLTSVTIPNSVASIGDYAFTGCKLTSVTIGNGVTSIGEGAFSGCWKLKKMTINSNAIANTPMRNYMVDPNSGEEIGITEIIIGTDVTSIGDYVFEACNSLNSINIPNSVTSIGWAAFNGCRSLPTITIPNSVTSIGGIAFSGCTALITVTIPNSIDSIRYGLFDGCVNLTSVSLSDNLTYIGDLAFRACGLSSIHIPNNVTYIGESAFEGCSNIKDFQIPNGVTHLRAGTFWGWGMKSLTIPAQVDSIDKYAFASCDSLRAIVWNAKNASGEDAHAAFAGCQIESMTIGEDVDSIPDFCFRHRKNLNYNTVMSTGGFDSLKSVVWNSKHCNIDYEYGFPENLEQITFGNKVEYIPRHLCERTKIKSLVIPNSVKTIGVEAFSFCYNLTSVIIGDGLETLEYDDNAYMGVFYGTHPTSVTCYATTPPTIHELFGSGFSTTIYVPASSVNAYKSADYWKEHWTILPIGATPVETDAIHITPSEYYADIVWKAIANAASYELVIEFMGNTWRFVFDAEGILTSMANHAPTRYDSPQGTQSAGFSYTVMGLASGTTYNVTITAKSANGSTLNTETASFTTTGEPQGIEDVNINDLQSKKIIRDGNVYVLRGDRVFTLQGQEVK